MTRPTETVPSPVPAEDTILHRGGCGSVRGRRERLAHWRAWHASGTRAINELCSGHTIASRGDLSRVQTLLCHNLVRAYLDVGRPPDDLTATGALRELCGLRVGHHDDECVPFEPGLAALPRAGSKPIDTITPCHVTRKRLNSSVHRWVLGEERKERKKGK